MIRAIGLAVCGLMMLWASAAPAAGVAGAKVAYPTRAVLEDVPKIGYGVHLSPSLGSLHAVLAYLKDPCDYDYLMGVSGAAFRRTWNRDDGGNVDLSYFGEEPFRAIFDALGYEYRMVPPKDRGAMLQALRESIARKKPVLAFGIVGPPECGIVTGYDRDGEVLVGWSYFQEGDTSRYYEQPDWFTKANWNGVTGFILLGDRKAKPAPRAVLVSSLERAIRFERMARLNADHSAGLKAYDDWAKGLEIDADYPKDDAKVMATRTMVHGDQCVMLEERRDAAKYLRRMAKVAPEAAEELNAAAACYDQVADQSAKTWPWGDRYMEVGPEFSDPAARRRIAAAVRIAEGQETQALTHLGAAYRTLIAIEMKGKPVTGKSEQRLVLKNVPRVAFWPKQNTSAPQDDLLPGALQAYLRFLNDTTDYDRLAEEPGDKWHHVHEYLMGASGHAFRLLWTGNWDFGPNTSFPAIDADPLKPVARAFDSIGYSYEVLLRSPFVRDWKTQVTPSDDETVYRAKIMENLQQGRPVIALGVVGPPEPCLIAGYDEGGDVLLGWNGFQEDPQFQAEIDEATGYFRKRDWFRDTQGLILVGERTARKSPREIYREALAWGLQIMRADQIQGRHAGQAAYQAWIDGLLKDDEIKALDEKALQNWYNMHYLTAGSLAEARAWGAPFLRQIITLAPETKEDLEVAIRCFDAEHDLVWATWEFTTPREGQTSLQRFADPGVRRRMVPLVRLMQEQDAEAAAHIEAALKRLSR